MQITKTIIIVDILLIRFVRELYTKLYIKYQE